MKMETKLKTIIRFVQPVETGVINMQIKLLEIRDRATFLPCFAMQTTADNSEQGYLLRRAGYGPDMPLIIFGYLDASRGKCHYDPYDWNDRTMKTAHNYIVEHFNKLNDGDVIDVEFVLGETTNKKTSERFED
jgi:hypothetical protein